MRNDYFQAQTKPGHKSQRRCWHYGLSGLLFLVGSVAPMAGQDRGKEPSDHEAKVYVNQQGSIYLREDQELYLWLSTEDGEQAKKYRMTSSSNPELTNPMPLDGHGVHEVTHDDHYENTEVKFQVYADGRSPRNSLSLNGAPRSQRAGKTYFGKGLSANISASDPMSGVENIYLARDGGKFAAYKNAVNVKEEREHRLEYYAADKVGNASKVSTSVFTVDVTAPKTTHRVSGTHLKDILAPSAKTPLSSTDGLSGVNRTRYQVDGGSERTYTGAFSLAGLSDGEHKLRYYSVDNVDNSEGANTYSFYLDKIAPEVQISVKGDQYQGRYHYVSPRTTYELSAQDNKAGVKEINYNFSRQPGTKTYQSAFKLPSIRGLHRIDYHATDKVENRSSTQGKLVYYDDQNPGTRISYGSPQFFGKDTLYITQDTKVTLRAGDAHSGVKKTEYALNDGGNKQYSSPFTIDKEDFYEISFASTDRVNNEETEKRSKVFVDNTPPQISNQFSIEPIGKKAKDGSSFPVYPNYVRFYMGATDHHCGTEKISYSIDGGPFQDYSSPRTLDVSEIDKFKSEKFYKVIIRAEDKLGNRAEKEVEFFVQKDF